MVHDFINMYYSRKAAFVMTLFVGFSMIHFYRVVALDSYFVSANLFVLYST